ncbi:MAG: 50S ribosomal protein L3 N(5)-glutamine methyltransferase [Burkholderiales bacterium]
MSPPATGIIPPATPRKLIAAAARRFRNARLAYGHGTLNADDEAAWLMVHALRCPFEQLAAYLDRPLPASTVRRAQDLFARRISRRIPAAYLTREAWLGEYRFYVDERVIVPRSYIAELLGVRLRPWLAPRRTPRRILDLCTGSGCLAIVAAHVFAGSQVDAADVSAAALEVARRNVRDHRLGRRVKIIRSDVFTALVGKLYDLILSNPPYVRAPVMRTLPAEYRHEPVLALHGGADGLDLVRRILGEAAAHLNPGGWLVLEVGHNRPRVERAFPGLPFIWAETSGGDDCVALLQKESMTALPGPASLPRKSAVPRRRPRVR